MASLANKYRPQKYEDVCGQASIIKILTRCIETNNIPHAIIFSGSSGCGKTTLARIFAKEINKGIGNPIEIDAASNNGVDNVRMLIDLAKERSLDSEYKVIICDEAHMLTTAAWNAFLKCVEEPPEYTIFIFCTTDPQKIPPTIINRCMKLNLSRIDNEKIRERLLFICKEMGYTNAEEACDYISRICHGQMRDAISMLEKCANYSSDISIANCLEALGNYSYDGIFDLVNNLIDCNDANTLSILNNIYNSGIDLKLFIDQFLSFILDVNKYCLTSDISITKLPTTMEDKVKGVINFDNAAQYYAYLTNRVLEIKNLIKNDTDPLSTISVKLMGVCRCM